MRPTAHTGWLALSGGLLCLALSACRTVYDVKVDAISAPQHGSGEAYRLALHPPAGAQGTPELQAAVAEQIRTALAQRGYFEAPEGTEARLLITASYGAGPAQLKFRYKARDMLGIDLWGKMPPKGGAEPITVYEKFMSLTARAPDQDAGGASAGGPEVWSVHVSVEDESGLLEPYLAVLAAALVDHIGEHSPGEKTVRIRAEGAKRTTEQGGPD